MKWRWQGSSPSTLEPSQDQGIICIRYITYREKFDFDRFYALEALRNNRDLSRFDPEQIKQLRVKIEEDKMLPTEDKKKRPKKTGGLLPDWM